MNNSTRALTVLLAASVFTVVGCSSGKILENRDVEYKKSRQAEVDLEVPPDLSSSTIASGEYMTDAGTPAVTTYSEYESQRSGANPTAGAGGSNASGLVLPENPTATIKRDGQQRWLVVNADEEAVWSNVLDFWRENGILLMEQDPVAGVMRTTWIENRADIKSDFVTNFLRKALDSVYSSGTRDQFRVRLERGEAPNTTELYLSHYRMEERLVSQTGATEVDRQIWVPKGTDPEIEAIMLQRIMAHMGIADQESKRLAGNGGSQPVQKRSDLITGRDVPHLVIYEDFARSWRLVGLSLDRVGFSVEDRDRSKGHYYVRYNDPSKEQDNDEGLLSKLAFWSKDKRVETGSRYIIAVRDEGESAKTTVLNENGQPEGSNTAKRILTLVHEQIR